MLTKAPLTSVDNPAVKNLVKLRRHRERARQGVMLIDGARALRTALHNGFAVSAVFCSQAVATEQAELLRGAQAAGASLQPVSARVFGKIGYGERPDGILAVAPCPRAALADLPVVDTPLYLVAERLEKPGNLGAMLRSAVAAGADALVLCDGRTDLWNPNVVRASQGACFAVPVAVAAADETLSWLRRRGRAHYCRRADGAALVLRHRPAGCRPPSCWGRSTTGLTSTVVLPSRACASPRRVRWIP